MKTQNFGEVQFITREESPEGIVLREDSTGVVLEEYQHTEEGMVAFYLDCFWNLKLRQYAELCRCLTEARKHESNLRKPIYVEIWEANFAPDSFAFWKENDLLYAEDEEWLRKEIESIASRL